MECGTLLSSWSERPSLFCYCIGIILVSLLSSFSESSVSYGVCWFFLCRRWPPELTTNVPLKHHILSRSRPIMLSDWVNHHCLFPQLNVMYIILSKYSRIELNWELTVIFELWWTRPGPQYQWMAVFCIFSLLKINKKTINILTPHWNVGDDWGWLALDL